MVRHSSAQEDVGWQKNELTLVSFPNKLFPQNKPVTSLVWKANNVCTSEADFRANTGQKYKPQAVLTLPAGKSSDQSEA